LPTQAVVEEIQEVRIPKSLAIRIQKIAPYGGDKSVDSYISMMLDEFVSQLEKTQPQRRRYNPFSDTELARIREEMKEYSLYP
jgi:hypothetical protein